MEKELERVLEERKVSGGRFPDFYAFETVGDKLLGQFIRTREFEDRPIYEIRDLKGKDWSLGAPVVLRRIFEEITPKPGDYVLITYDGEGKSKKGRKVKLFSAGKLSEEEAKNLLKEKKFLPEVKPSPVPEKPAEKPPEVKKTTNEFETIVEKIVKQFGIDKNRLMDLIHKKREELSDFVTLEGAASLVAKELEKEKPVPAPSEKLSPEKRDEIREFLDKLFTFYDEMKKDDLTKRITNRFPDLTLEKILDICDDFLRYDSTTDVLKKK